MITTTDVLAERTSPDGRVRWQAVRSADRGRLAVRGIVEPSASSTIIEPLNEQQLRELLEHTPDVGESVWCCATCGAKNSIERKWCAACSETN